MCVENIICLFKNMIYSKEGNYLVRNYGLFIKNKFVADNLILKPGSGNAYAYACTCTCMHAHACTQGSAISQQMRYFIPYPPPPSKNNPISFHYPPSSILGEKKRYQLGRLLEQLGPTGFRMAPQINCFHEKST